MEAAEQASPVNNGSMSVSSNRPAIEVRGLRKFFRAPAGHQVVNVLSDIDLEVASGHFLSLVGPSGCGKTTLLNIVAGLIPYDRGIVLRLGEPVHGPSLDAGIVFQAPNLVPWRTALDNVLLAAQLAGRKRKNFLERAESLLALVGLKHSMKRYPRQLSGGMQQRVAIARALLLTPDLLLMDEPFGALDALTREQLNLELQRIWSETKCTVIFVTHSISEAVLLSDEIVVMSPGPSSRVAYRTPVPLGRPRGLELSASPDFGELVQTVRSHLKI
jgi:NitT/TauT family transport system ATP-binding protein